MRALVWRLAWGLRRRCRPARTLRQSVARADGPFKFLDAPTESLCLTSQLGELRFASGGSGLPPFRNLGVRYSGIWQELAFDNAAMPGALGAFDHSRRP